MVFVLAAKRFRREAKRLREPISVVSVTRVDLDPMGFCELPDMTRVVLAVSLFQAF